MALRQVYDDNGTLKSKDIAGSGSANAADTVYDNSTTGLPANVQGALDKTTGNISSLGTVELTATAAHAHAVGTSFMLIGQLVKTTSTIEVGDTIAVGTNVEPTSILDVISELNAANIAYNNTSSGLTATDVQGAIEEIDGKIDSKIINNIIAPSATYNLQKTANVIIVFPFQVDFCSCSAAYAFADGTFYINYFGTKASVTISNNLKSITNNENDKYMAFIALFL